MAQRVTFYIDGFNFYYGLRRTKRTEPQWGDYYWIDIVKLCAGFLGEDQVVEKVIYFTSSPLNPEKSSRQSAFLNANKIINGDKTLDPSDPGYNGIADKIDQVYEDFYPEAQEGEDPLPSIKEQIEALQAMVDTINEIVQGDTEDPTSKTLEQRLNELEALINPASGEGTLTTEVEAATEALESIGTVLTVNDSTGTATLDNTTLGPNSVVPASVVTESDSRKFVTAAQLALINTIGSRTKMCTVQVTVPLSSWSENTSNKHFYKTIQVQSGSIKIPTTTSPIMDLVTTANYNTAQKQEEVYSYIFKATVSSLGNVTLYASKDPSTVTSDISSITIQFQFWYTDSDTVS